MNNLIHKVAEVNSEEVKNYGITEVFVIDGEVYITSEYDLPCELAEEIENLAK